MYPPLESIVPPMVAAFAVASTVLTVGTGITEKFAPKVIEGSGSVSGPVTAGSINIVTWEIIKRTDCPGEASRTWSGEHNFYLVEPITPAALPKSDTAKTYNIQTRTPELAPVGTLELKLVGFYQCPGAVREAFTLGPVLFEVIHPSQGG